MKKLTENMEKKLIFMIFLSFAFADERIFLFGVPVYFPELLILVLLAICGFRLFVQKSLFWKPIPKEILLPIGLIFFGAVSSMIVNGTDHDALGAIKSWFVFPILFAGIIYQLGFSRKDWWKAFFCWFIGVGMVSFGALFIPGLSSETYDGRIHSIFPSPNHFAFFLEYGAVIGIGLMLLFIRKSLHLLSLAVVEAMIVAALLMTGSDGALVATVVGAIVFLVVSGLPLGTSKKIGKMVAVSVPLLFFFLAVAIYWESLGSGSVRTSAASRVMVWGASVHMLAEAPLFGIGLRNFQDEYLALQPEFPPYLEWAVPHPHNLLLSFWLFCGFFGLLGFALLLFNLFRMMLRAGERSSLVGVIPFALLVVFLTHGLVDTPYFRNDLSYMFFAIVAGIAILSKQNQSIEMPR